MRSQFLTKLKLLSVLLFLFFISNSCRKDRGSLIFDENLIGQAKSFFNDEVARLPNIDDDDLTHSLKKSPIWEKSVVRKMFGKEAVIVPIKYDKIVSLKEENATETASLDRTSYLLIYKDKEERLTAEWVKLLPVENLGTKNFVGIVNIEEWNGKPKKAFAINEKREVLPIYGNRSHI